jgi:hypothetical protein
MASSLVLQAYAMPPQLAAPLLIPLQAFGLVLRVPLMQAFVLVLSVPLTAVGVGFGVGLQHAQVFVLLMHAQLASSGKGPALPIVLVLLVKLIRSCFLLLPYAAGLEIVVQPVYPVQALVVVP